MGSKYDWGPIVRDGMLGISTPGRVGTPYVRVFFQNRRFLKSSVSPLKGTNKHPCIAKAQTVANRNES